MTKYRDAAWLRQKYVDEGLSTYDIAELCDVTCTTISTWLNRYSIETRPAHGGHSRVEYAHYTMHHHGYMQWETTHRLTSGRDRKHVYVRVHQLLAIAEGTDPHRIFGKASSHVVHHKNGCRFDNRPDNIEVMSRSEHTSHHWDDREAIPRDGNGEYRKKDRADRRGRPAVRRQR